MLMERRLSEVQTPFGGGKTHALLTFYHMVNSPREAMSVPGARDALGDLTIPSDAKVLVFDGQEYGVEPWLKENGVSVSTMWGELASQVDAGLYNRTCLPRPTTVGRLPAIGPFQRGSGGSVALLDIAG